MSGRFYRLNDWYVRVGFGGWGVSVQPRPERHLFSEREGFTKHHDVLGHCWKLLRPAGRSA